MLYHLGCVYKIFCEDDENISYIGSTFNCIEQRLESHKKQYQLSLEDNNITYKYALRPYFEKYGVDRFKIVKLKDYVCCRSDKYDLKQLHAYEALWINKLKCINVLTPFNPLSKLTAKMLWCCPICKTLVQYKERNRHQKTKKCLKAKEQNGV